MDKQELKQNIVSAFNKVVEKLCDVCSKPINQEEYKKGKDDAYRTPPFSKDYDIGYQAGREEEREWIRSLVKRMKVIDPAEQENTATGGWITDIGIGYNRAVDEILKFLSPNKEEKDI